MLVLQGVLSLPSAFSARVGDQQLSKPQNYDDKDPRGVSPEDPCCRILLGSAIDQCSQSYTCGKFVGMPVDGNHPGTQVNAFACSEQRRCSGVNTDVFVEEKLDANDCTLHKSQTLPVVPAKIKVEHSDNLLNSLGDGVNGFVGADVAAVVVKNEIPTNFPDDDLDHIVLKERRRMLLSRCHFVINIYYALVPFSLDMLRCVLVVNCLFNFLSQKHRHIYIHTYINVNMCTYICMYVTYVYILICICMYVR